MMSSSTSDSSIVGMMGSEILPATSSVLTSAAFYIGQACQKYHSEFILCKHEKGRHPEQCLQQGWKVTECAYRLLSKLKEHCDSEFSKHWQCLDMNNQEYQYCREQETLLDTCIFRNMGLQRKIELPLPDVMDDHDNDNK